MILDWGKRYDRVNNILYEDGVPIVRLKQPFIDVEDLRINIIEYMEKYMTMFPDLYEKIDNMQYDVIKLFYDLETTGVKSHQHGIHHISGLIEVNDVVEAKFDIRVKPNSKALIEDEALKISNTTREDLEDFMEMGIAYKKILNIILKYINRYDKKSKIHLVGYNNRKFDDDFFRKWFEQNGDAFFGAYFFSDSLDAMVLASEYLLDRRSHMPNFKLARVAKELGIIVDESGLHDALYDLELTREIYRIVTGRDIEL